MPLRSRATARMAADRIAPEEYEAAMRAVLAGGTGLSRSQLTSEVRAVLGFARTGAALDEAIGAAVDAMVASGELGEGSAGLRLRGAPAPTGVERGLLVPADAPPLTTRPGAPS